MGSPPIELKGMKYAICTDLDGHRNCHTESSKSDKDKHMILLACGVLKNGTNEHIYKTEMSYKCRKQTLLSWLQFSCWVLSDSLQPHRLLQHDRLPCPTPIPGACSNSCPSSQWCHPAISPSVVHFFSCLQTFLASGSFLMSGQRMGASASESVLPMNIEDWFP